ncbi:acyltransferase [Gammaproteobacteria bacterium]|nr:acyltransferase [Gammaproteobacteria bacterium]
MKLSQPASNYQPHIDGLRAIAILSVLFFHVDISAFKGGYVGVDIFFVISGYLITSHLLTNIESPKFSLKDFYHRRARRLLPALLVTVVTTFAVGAFIFPASNFERLANSSLMSLFSLSNIFFWSESGYFDSNASLKPLLHMWSLSVEEQFYLVWPALLLILSRKNLVPLGIAVTSIISLIACEFVLMRDPAAAFFLTPFRIIEFSMGASLVWLGGYPLKNKLIVELLCLLGFILLSISIFSFSEASRFPGFLVLLPCLGAVLLIYAGKTSTIGLLIRNKVMIWVGLISYSLYLVHWPLIVFYKYYNATDLMWFDAIALVVVSLILASVMYLLVEKPFRKTNERSYSIPSRTFFAGLATFLVVFSVTATHASYSEGWQWRYSTPQLTKDDISEGMGKRFDIYRKICETRGWGNCARPSEDRNRNILIMGDSHAPDALNIFHQTFPHYHYVLQEQGGCPPIVERDMDLLSPKHPDRAKCVQLNIDRFSSIAKDDYSVIVISVLFGWYKPEHLARAIDQIKSSSDAKIIVLGNYIQLKNKLTDYPGREIDIEKQSELILNFALYENELTALAVDNFQFVSKKSLLCNDGDVGSCILWFDAVPFTWDEHHLSYEASTYISSKLKAKSIITL